MSEKKEMWCPCCGFLAIKLIKNVWVSEAVCVPCLKIWYADYITNPKEIRRRRLLDEIKA